MLSYNNITLIIYVFMVPFGENPSCLQTTLPSLVDQKSSQTVPHWLLKQISTLPSAELRPPRSLISPSRQGTEAREVTLVVWLRSCMNTHTIWCSSWISICQKEVEARLLYLYVCLTTRDNDRRNSGEDLGTIAATRNVRAPSGHVCGNKS